MSLKSAQKFALALKQSLFRSSQAQALQGSVERPLISSAVAESLDISKPVQEQVHIPGKYQDYFKVRKPRRLRDVVDQDTSVEIQKRKDPSLPEDARPILDLSSSLETTSSIPAKESLEPRKYKNMRKLSGRIRQQLESVLQEPDLQSVLKTSSWRLSRVEITSGLEGIVIYWVPFSTLKSSSLEATTLEKRLDMYLKKYSGVIYKLLMQRMKVRSFPSRLTFKRDSDQERSSQLESIFTEISKDISN
jgi:ribosome-binding factor A